MEQERPKPIDRLPIHADLERFAPDYFPEQFTDEERELLAPFFSNLDQPVYIIQHLPEEVAAALSSRYSRATTSMRRTFLKEYVEPIIHPENQTSWETANNEEKAAAAETREKFYEIVQFLNQTGGVDYVVNLQRARKFFDVWLSGYGDDSIAELGGVHIAIEGISNLALEEIVNKRVGQALLVKSSRYVSYSDRNPDGSFKFITPGELKGTEYEVEYIRVMNLLFETYADFEKPYLEYIKELYPQGDDETSTSFKRSRGAKRYDDIRDILPFATQNNLGLYANARSMEDLISRLALHPNGECRWLGQKLFNELQNVVPSLVSRAGTSRGGEAQTYRANIKDRREKMLAAFQSQKESNPREQEVIPTGPVVRLVDFTPESDVTVLTSFLFSGGSNISYAEIREWVSKLESGQRSEMIGEILNERAMGDSNATRDVARFRKVPRAFETVHYIMEWWGRGGDYRDLHRHRQMTEDHQPFTTAWGYDLEEDLLNSPFAQHFHNALSEASALAAKIAEKDPHLAQYVVPYSFIQHWFTDMSARSLYWQAELRTGPQGRPHYRKLVQQATALAKEATPAVMQGVYVDMEDHKLARRESEIKAEKKRERLR